MRVLLIVLAACLFVSAAGPPRRWTQKAFLITYWCPPPATDADLARAAAEGFNLTWVPEAGLAVAARQGLRAMLTDELLVPASLEDPVRRGRLDALVARVKGQPALEAYYLTDEPSAEAFAGWGRLVAYLRERDPGHLAYINLFPVYAGERQLGVAAPAGPGEPGVRAYREHLRRYLAEVRPDLISYDHYSFFKAGDGDRFFLNLGLIREAAKEAGRPFLNIIQTNTIEPTWRLPSAGEVRWLVYATLAYGGRGISYFTYWGDKALNGLYQDTRPGPLMPAVALLNRELTRLGPTLLELESVAVYHSGALPPGTEPIPAEAPVRIAAPGGFILGLFRQGRRLAFMVVNRDASRAASARLTLAGSGRRVQELDRSSGRWVTCKRLDRGRGMAVALAPGDGRLFRLD